MTLLDHNCMWRTVVFILCCYKPSLYGFQNSNNFGDSKAYFHLGTKSLYFHHIVGTFHYPLPFEIDSITDRYEPVHIDALYRHGTRYPKKEKVSRWKSTIAKLSTFQPKNETMNLLKKWNIYFPRNLSYALHETGWKELQTLAAHWSVLAGNLFYKIAEKYRKEEFDDFTFLVYSSPKSRVVASADAFLSALLCKFSEYMATADNECATFEESKYLPEPFPEDVLKYERMSTTVKRNYMRAFDDCVRYVHYVEQNHTSHHEYHQFLRSEWLSEIQEHLEEKFPGSDITRVDVIALFQLCSFLLVLHENDFLCQLFTDEHLKVLEYASDLRHYYVTGYGNSINYQLSCRLLYDVIRHLEDGKKSAMDDKPSVVLRFGHAETLIPFLCLLGLYKDNVPLTAESYDLHKNKRMFRTGTFSPFAGNIAIILYKHTTHPEGPLKIAFVLNGHYIKLPTFDDCYLCDYDLVMVYFYAILAKIDCDTLCNRPIIHDEL